MIRFGIVGCGGRGAGMTFALVNAYPEVKVVGVVDPDERGARARLGDCGRKAVFYKTLKEMVRKGRLDCLMIATRCHQHTPYAIEAAACDIPLFLEKPVAISMEQAQALECAYQKARNSVVVSFPLRVSPLCRLTRQYVEEKAVGRPEHILAVNYVPYGTIYFDGGYRNYAITQGLFLQKATHDFDYMMYLMGNPIVRVAAMKICGRVFGGCKQRGLVCGSCGEARTCLESPENRKLTDAGGDNNDHPCVFGEEIGTPRTGMNEDASSALVEFADGAQGVYTQVFFTRRDAGARGATISGYHGTLRFDWYTNELRRVRHFAPFSDTIRAGGNASHFGGDTALLKNFMDVVKGAAPSLTPIGIGIQSVYACLAAKESAETGKYVKVRQTGASA